MPRAALIVANGILPVKSVLDDLINKSDFVLAADGAVNKLIEVGITPDAVLGDFDSIRFDIPESVDKIHAPDQNFTDLEKAVLSILNDGFTDITITGVTGARLDHTFGALGILCKYKLKMVDDFASAFCVFNNELIRLNTHPGQIISLMPMGNVSGLNTSGLKWNMVNSDFNFAERDGTSNEALGNEISLSISSGMLVVYLHHSK